MRKRDAMIVLAAAAVLAAVIVAASSGGGGSRHHSARAHPDSASAGASELAIAASYLGLPRAQLRKELRSGQSLAQIASTTRGKSTVGLIAALVRARAGQLDGASAAGAKPTSRTPSKSQLASLRRRVKRQVNRVRGYIGLAAIGRYLGFSTARLHAELESGHSLAQIASAIPGKSPAGLIAARVSAREAVVKAALTSGRISQSTEKTLLSSLRQRVEAEVDRTPRR